MQYLLDTHVLLWAINGDVQLGARAQAILNDPSNRVHVSVVSLWELMIKERTGKLQMPPNLFERLRKKHQHILSVSLDHVEVVRGLPLHHKDPFDRLLVAQAHAESMTLLTRDHQLQRYPIATMLV